MKTRVGLFVAIFVLAAAQSAWAKDNWWTGATDNNWNTGGNWESSGSGNDNRKFGGTESDGESKFNDLFKNTYDYTVYFTGAESSGWKVHIRSGTEEHPIVFEADSAANGLTVGNTTTGNNTGYYIGYDASVNNEAWLKLKRGTWDTKSGGYWFVGQGNSSTGHVIVCDGAIVACSNDFKLACGSLTINGGTMTVGAWTRFENSSCDKTINLNGGTLTTYCINSQGTSGTQTLMFNGGTLKNPKSNKNPLIHANIAAKVGANGGTINANNIDTVINANFSDNDASTPGSMKFVGGGKVTLGGTAGWTGGTTVEVGTTLAVANAANVAAILGHGLTVNASSVVPTGTVVFSTTDGTISVAQLANCSLTGDYSYSYYLALGEGDKSIILKDAYVWNGGTDGSNAWSDENVWRTNSVDATWSDGGAANFNTDGAQASLAANAEAAKVGFLQNASIGAGGGTLIVPVVDVGSGVSATISAPTAGELMKTGEGTLTLGASRTDQTTLSEGTLAMSGATVDGTKLTLGTDAAKPVVFDYGGQTFSANLSLALGGYDVSLTNGNFTSTDKLVVADGTLRVKKDSSVSANGHVVVGGTSDTATSTDINAFLEIDGGAVTNSASSKHCIIGDYGEEGSVSRMVVKNGSSYYSRQDIVVGNRSTGYLTVDNSTVEAYGYLYFCYDAECLAGENGYVSLTNNGVLAVQKVTYRNGAGNGYFNFDGGTLKATASKTLLEKKDRLFVTVNAAGGTIDNDGKTITINADLLGEGDMTLIGSGTITIGGSQTGTGALNVNAGTVVVDGGVSVARPTTVADGATLTVNGAAQETVNTLTLDAGSTLNIASYSGNDAPLSVTTLTLPDSGTVALTLNGGAFPVGTYKILDKAGIAVAAVEGKLVPSTGSETGGYSIDGSTLVLTVGTPVHGRWRSAAGSGNFSDPGNWEDGQVPGAGDALDFSGVTSGITINCVDMGETKFGAVTMGAGVSTFTGSLKAASFSDTSKIAVGENSTVTLDGNLVFGGTTTQYIVYTVAAGGRFVVTGHIEASSDMTGGQVFQYVNPGLGAVQAKGLVANEGTSDEWTFRLSSDSNGTANWIVGAEGLSGSKYFFAMKDSNKKAAIQPLDSNFTITTQVGIRAPLTFNTTGYDGNGHTITIAPAGVIGRDGALTISGTGKVLVDAVNTHSGGITVTDTATLAINADKKATTGSITVKTNATLQVAQSAASAGIAAVTLGGGLTLKNGAALGFNYTTRNAPVLDLTGKTVTFDEGETTNVVVKIMADAGKRAKGGANVLTSGGKFEGVNVTLAEKDKPAWALGVDVENGEIVLNVKPLPTIFIVR